MELVESGSDDPLWIDEFDGESFVIGKTRFDGSVSLTLSGAQAVGFGIKDLTAPMVRRAIEDSGQKPDLAIFGTGTAPSAGFGPRALPAEAARELAAAGVGFDAMRTDAAARAVNMIRADGRLVIAWLFVDAPPEPSA